MQLTDYLNSINFTKKNIIRGNEVSQSAAEKAYPMYPISLVLSYHQDCVLFVNELNCMPTITGIQHYEFLLNTLRGKKRPYIKMEKSVKGDAVDLFLERLMTHYGYNRTKAVDAARLYSDDQKAAFMASFDEGGASTRKN